MSEDQTTTADQEVAIEAYDFNAPSRIPPEQEKTIQLLHETFAENAALRLSAYLNSEVTVSLDNVEQTTFQEYTSGLSAPTCMVTLDMHPLSGYSVMEVNNVLMYGVVDKMLGGKGEDKGIKRPFTDLELSISKKFFKIMLQELSQAWSSILAISFSMKDFFTNPAGVRSIPTREVCLVVTFKMTIAGASGLATLSIPYASLEPISAKLRNEQFNNRYRAKQPEEILKAHTRNFSAMEVDVTAYLGQMQLTVEELILLQEGDILDLGQKVNDLIEVQVAGTPKYRATPGLVGKYKGAIIKEEVSNG